MTEEEQSNRQQEDLFIDTGWHDGTGRRSRRCIWMNSSGEGETRTPYMFDIAGLDGWEISDEDCNPLEEDNHESNTPAQRQNPFWSHSPQSEAQQVPQYQRDDEDDNVEFLIQSGYDLTDLPYHEGDSVLHTTDANEREGTDRRPPPVPPGIDTQQEGRDSGSFLSSRSQRRQRFANANLNANARSQNNNNNNNVPYATN